MIHFLLFHITWSILFLILLEYKNYHLNTNVNIYLALSSFVVIDIIQSLYIFYRIVKKNTFIINWITTITVIQFVFLFIAIGIEYVYQDFILYSLYCVVLNVFNIVSYNCILSERKEELEELNRFYPEATYL